MNWDIFCNVVDNFGDIGVSWRLARQLVQEYGQKARLWVDDLESFCRLCPEGENVEVQNLKGVEVRRWMKPFPEVLPPDVVIESFGCKLPESYVAKMAAMEKKPVWINLEYLSAEDWVKDVHLMPSPHPKLPLVKSFFFPGFSKETGGLLIEKGLLDARHAFLNDSEAIRDFWHALDIDPAGRLSISLFCYENSALEPLFEAWAAGEEKILCLVPEGRIGGQVRRFFGNAPFCRGNLEARFIPFVEQEKYDFLLWACDINFVRGEDSFVRAQWAGKPFVWQIYPQDEKAHLKKLEAFLDIYGKGLPACAAEATKSMWRAWNGEGNSGAAWKNFLQYRAELDAHGKNWARQLSGNSLAANLVDFLDGRR